MTASPSRTLQSTRGLNIALWVAQVLLAVFFVAGAAGPKLFGQDAMVDLFDDIGAGQWLRFVVGVLELAGGVGLLVPRLAGLAALGLAGLMFCAALTQLFVLGAVAAAVIPVILGVLAGLVAWGRWPQTHNLLSQMRS